MTKVAELEGAELDYWVAKALRYDAVFHEAWSVENKPTVVIEDPRPGRKTKLKVFRPSEDWLEGGPLIERERIAILPMAEINGNKWGSQVLITRLIQPAPLMRGPTVLIAAMRCFVASRFGDEVA